MQATRWYDMEVAGAVNLAAVAVNLAAEVDTPVALG